MAKTKNKTERIYFRVTNEKKKELQEKAHKARLTVTELIMNRIENLPVKDYQKENEFLLKVTELNQTLGYIGNNINQVTTAIHQMKNSLIIDNKTIDAFNSLMRQYLETRKELGDNLKKIYFS